MTLLRALTAAPLLLQVLLLPPSFVAQDASSDVVCVAQLSSCSCRLADGRVVDLAPLRAYGGGPAFSQAAADGYTYQYNPCGGYRCGEEAEAALCQEKMLIIVQYADFGVQSSAKFDTDPTTGRLRLSYRSRDASKNSAINLICDPTAAEPVIVTQGAPGAGNQLTMDLRSLGDILLIVCLTLLAVYLLAGALFNRFARRRTGLDALPNVAFWTALPGLVADGAAFVCERARALVCAGRGGGGGYADIK